MRKLAAAHLIQILTEGGALLVHGVVKAVEKPRCRGDRQCRASKAPAGTSSHRTYDYEVYRCYRKISSKRTCEERSTYKAAVLNKAVEQQVKIILSKIQFLPKERLMEFANARNEENCKLAFKQA